MVSCAACCQTKNAKTREIGVSFHRFPKDPERRKIWTAFVKKKDWEPSTSAFLCSLHFAADCFDRTSLCNIRLKELAVPTVSILRPKYDRSELALCKVFLPECSPDVFPIKTEPLDIDEKNFPLVEPEPYPPPRDPLLETTEEELKQNSPESHPSTKDPVFETVQELRLKRKIVEIANENILKSKKIRLLQKQVWQQKQLISNLRQSLKELKKEFCLKPKN